MNAALQQLVRERSRGRCEYCLLPQFASFVPFEIDHVIACKHKGRTVATNLAMTCVYCNAHKGPNIAGIDPATGKLTKKLFHPRRHQWTYHFRYDGGVVIGRTAIGRTTADVLRMNLPNLVALREVLMEEGSW